MSRRCRARWLCRDRGILFVVDATQSFGAFPIDVEACGIDALAFAGKLAGDDFDDWRQARGGFRADWTGANQRVYLSGDAFQGESEHRGFAGAVEIRGRGPGRARLAVIGNYSADTLGALCRDNHAAIAGAARSLRQAAR